MSLPARTKGEFAAKGDDLYDRLVRPVAEPSQNGKVVVINIDTGSFEIDRDEIAASQRLLTREPSSLGRQWFRTIGKPYLHRFLGIRQRSAT